MAEIVFEDFAAGQVATYGRHEVDRDAMIAFAREFDPQPFHLSEAAAAASPVGRLIASGWYTAALMMRLYADGLLLRAAGLGAPGVEEVKWLRPVAAGDVLSLRQSVLDTRPSGSRPDRGLVRFRLDVLRGDDLVMSERHWVMFGRRGMEPARHGSRPAAVAEPSTSGVGVDDDVVAWGKEAAEAARRAPTDFDAVVVGTVTPLGRHHFTAADIIRFGRAFDPQPFHVDPEAAARSAFGGLAASGWHTAAAWMSHLVAHRAAVAAAAREDGREPPRYGVSPGFRDLVWLKPVYAGDTIRFESEVIETRPSASRPGWGLVTSRNSGWNGRGEKVFAFTGGGFMARRGAAA